MRWPDKDDQRVVDDMKTDLNSPEWKKCRDFIITHYIIKVCPDYIRDDVAQETLIKIFRYLDTFSGAHSLARWVVAILTRTAIDFFRKEQSRKTYVSLDAFHNADKEGDEKHEIAIETRTPEDDYITREAIDEAVTRYREMLETQKLKNGKRDFDIWNHRVLWGQDVKKVAEQLNIKTQTVQRIAREAKQYFSQFHRID